MIKIPKNRIDIYISQVDYILIGVAYYTNEFFSGNIFYYKKDVYRNKCDKYRMQSKYIQFTQLKNMPIYRG